MICSAGPKESPAEQPAQSWSGCGPQGKMSLTYQIDEHLDCSPKNWSVYWFWRTTLETLKWFQVLRSGLTVKQSWAERMRASRRSFRRNWWHGWVSNAFKMGRIFILCSVPTHTEPTDSHHVFIPGLRVTSRLWWMTSLWPFDLEWFVLLPKSKNHVKNL